MTLPMKPEAASLQCCLRGPNAGTSGGAHHEVLGGALGRLVIALYADGGKVRHGLPRLVVARPGANLCEKRGLLWACALASSSRCNYVSCAVWSREGGTGWGIMVRL